MILGGVAALAGLVYCVLFLVRRRQISDSVSLQLTGALLSVMVGCKLMNIWLLSNYRSDFHDYRVFVMWREGLFSAVPFWAMIYLFSAVTGHYLIFATGRLIQEHRRKVLTRATGAIYCAAVVAMAATILMTVKLCPPYDALTAQLEQRRMVTREDTERYLTDWIQEDPDSLHAQQLYRAFHGEFVKPEEGFTTENTVSTE